MGIYGGVTVSSGQVWKSRSGSQWRVLDVETDCYFSYRMRCTYAAPGSSDSIGDVCRFTSDGRWLGRMTTSRDLVALVAAQDPMTAQAPTQGAPDLDQAWAEIRDTMADTLLNDKQKEVFVRSILAGVLANPVAAPQGEAERLREAARKMVDDLDDLIGQSRGVIGLHLNGDEAPWEDLCEGGRYEGWLGSLETLRAALGGDR